MRGGWARRCAEGEGRRAVDRLEKGKAGGSGDEFVMWVENALDLAEVCVQSLEGFAK